MATASELFQKAGFVARKKGQRYPQRVLATFCFASKLPEDVESFYVIGQSDGYDGFGQATKYDNICLTLKSGVRVPCYRQNNSWGSDYNIVQDSNFLLKNPE